MLKTVKRAIKFYNEKPDEWKAMVKRAMSADYSWNNSASKYSDLYMKLTKRKIMHIYFYIKPKKSGFTGLFL